MTRRVDVASPPSVPSNAESLGAPRGADLLSRCTHIPPGCRDTKKTFPQQKRGRGGETGGLGTVEKTSMPRWKSLFIYKWDDFLHLREGKGGGENHSKNSCSRGRRWRSRLAVERPSQVSTSIVPANALLVQAKRKRKEERKKNNDKKTPPRKTLMIEKCPGMGIIFLARRRCVPPLLGCVTLWQK